MHTQGCPSSKKLKRRKKACAVLAFANDPHLDKCDLLSDELQTSWATEVTDMLSSSEDPFVIQICNKILELKNTFGLGLPAT
jgi:hypothetical protein